MNDRAFFQIDAASAMALFEPGRDCLLPRSLVILAGSTGTDGGFDDDCIAPPTGVENDCHHPDSLPQRDMMGEGPFTQPLGSFTLPLPHAFHLVQSPYTPTGPVVLAPQPWQQWQRFQVPDMLRDNLERRLAQLALLHPLNTTPQLCAGSPDTLTAWLHVTNACNLDCPYCYVRKSSERMSLETGLRAVEAIMHNAREHGFRAVKLKYAGGESTLHMTLIRRLHEHARRLAERLQINLQEVVLSNGVHLRPADADWLAETRIKIVISLDGVGELHNRLRPLRNREGVDTFAAVEYTIDHVLRPRGIKPDISMTVTGLNAGGAAAVARWAMLDRGLPTGFSFYRPNLLSRGRHELEMEEQALIDGMLAAYRAIESDLPTRPFFNGLLDRVAAEVHQHTCGVGLNYLVITHTGMLAQCQMHLDQPVQSDLNGDLLHSVSRGPLLNLPVSQKSGCRACEFRYRCAGGCPVETFRVTGRWDVQSPNCRLYKTLLPATLRLEGLRLMKVGGYLN
jgi:uncharacterized protein